MAAHRPYRAGVGVEHALDQVRADRGTKYDTDVVAACMILHKHGGLQPLVAR
jgi:HD-GYP domain-containing protein (c-di-GMP phosphodiesterase class II)